MSDSRRPAAEPGRHGGGRPFALGLRARVLTAFTMGALVLSALLATVTFGLVRENLVRQRESVALDQAYLNARIVRDGLRSAGVEVRDVLDSLGTTGGGTPLLLRDGRWFAPQVGVSQEDLPEELRQEVNGGGPARMRFSLDGHTQLGVGVPLPAVQSAYFEVTSFEDLEGTLRSLGISLLAAALVTTLAGAALGVSVSHRVLRPLSQVSAAAVAIAGGRLDTRVMQIDDPDLRTLVTSFNDMAGALQARIERDARFASDVSHELRSPLTTLSASIQVLESRRDEMPERARAALDLLVADVRRFSTMVEDLLEISRIDAGATRLDRSSVRIGELVMHAIAASTSADVPLAIAADAVDCVVQADKRRLVRVIANLVGNAESHGGGAECVSVDLVDHHVRVSIEDAGPGVDEADRERIFERFARGAAAGSRGTGAGVGLGLALVREHVQLHGGEVWVQGRGDGKPGARFVVQLPVADSPQQPSRPDPGPAGVPA